MQLKSAWFEDNGDEGWIAAINFRDHVLKEFKKAHIDYYFIDGYQKIREEYLSNKAKLLELFEKSGLGN